MKRPEPDQAATLREFREYLALSYEANHRVARRIGITVVTFNNFLSGKGTSQAKTLGKIRAFLRAEAKRTGRDGIRSRRRRASQTF
jgi:hypothetical protein